MKKFFYRVQRDETVVSIAEKFCVCVFEIIKENMLNEEVEEGDIIEIVKSDNVYKVLPHEDVVDVSKKLGVPVDLLLNLNGNPKKIFYGIWLKY